MFVFTIDWQQQKAATFATWTRLIASVFPQLFQGNKCSGEFGVFRIDRVLGHHNRYHLTPITLDYIDWNILSLIFARCSVLCKSQAISVALCVPRLQNYRTADLFRQSRAQSWIKCQPQSFEVSEFGVRQSLVLQVLNSALIINLWVYDLWRGHFSTIADQPQDIYRIFYIHCRHQNRGRDQRMALIGTYFFLVSERLRVFCLILWKTKRLVCRLRSLKWSPVSRI